MVLLNGSRAGLKSQTSNSKKEEKKEIISINRRVREKSRVSDGGVQGNRELNSQKPSLGERSPPQKKKKDSAKNGKEGERRLERCSAPNTIPRGYRYLSRRV